MKNYIVITAIFLSLVSCSLEDESYTPIPATDLDAELSALIDQASQGEGNSYFTLPSSSDYAAIPQDPLNPITPEKVALGQLLLHETAVGGKPKMGDRKFQYVCATCHPVGAGFNAGRRQGIGEGGMGFGLRGEGRFADTEMPLDSLDVQPVRPPTLLNLAYQDVALWDGRFGGTGTNEGTEDRWDLIPENFQGFQGIEVQAMQGQDEHRLLIDEDFVDTYGYRAMFDAAFPEVDEANRYTRETGALAIAAFNRTLLSNQAPWQDYLKGNSQALSPREKRGAIVFFDQGKCVQCHTGPGLKDQGFHALGFGDFDNSPDAIVKPNVNMDLVSRGRGGFTGNPQDDYKFKTPTLYNLVDNGFFGHGGTFTSVRQVIEYMNGGQPQNNQVPLSQLADEFGGLGLTTEQIDDLTAFIERGLRDPNLERYVPAAVKSGFCFPANDPLARQDLGCN
ncbi:cytochrome-c peroxidase [Croceiramulus getboli]|nr:cytochrome c peroxidase [Flavobacteriaceae bacterium YJPT1-3]